MNELETAEAWAAGPPSHAGDPARQRWMSILARSVPERLEALWERMEDRPSYRIVRQPEVGLAMVQARAGGGGLRFNLGEVTVSRCAVATQQGYLGVGYVRGRRLRHAELAAVFDAMLQDPLRRAPLERDVVQPLLSERLANERVGARAAEATRVEFFTVVRGENE